MFARAQGEGSCGQRGQALTEYALVMALVVLAAAVGLATLGAAVNGFFEGFMERLSQLLS